VAIAYKTNQISPDSGAFRSCFALFVNARTVSALPELSLSKLLDDRALAKIVNDYRELNRGNNPGLDKLSTDRAPITIKRIRFLPIRARFVPAAFVSLTGLSNYVSYRDKPALRASLVE